MPILDLLLLALPAGALVICLLPRPHLARHVAATATLVALLISVSAVLAFDPALSGFQFVSQHDWIPSLGVRYLVGVDGISILLLPVTLILLAGSILVSWNSVSTMPRAYYSLLLLEAATSLTVFCALDTMLFFMAWELSIVPLYFLVSIWGTGDQRRAAANKYALVMIAGGLPLLLALLLLAQQGTGHWDFDLRSLLESDLPLELQVTLLLLFVAGFGIKAPLPPAHTWFPLLALEGPVAVTALLAGLKLGVYGLIRIAIPIAPAATVELNWLLTGLGTAGVLYGAVVALAQSNLRATLAYLGISHVGLVVLGLATLHGAGIEGATVELVNFAVVGGGLFLLTGLLRARVGSTSLSALGGAARRLPWLAVAYLLLGLASLGLPGTSGFVAEFPMLIATVDHHLGVGIAALAGVTTGAACFTGLYRRAFFGTVSNPALQESQDLLPRERMVAVILVAFVLVIGLYPQLALDIMETGTSTWLLRVAPVQP